MQVRCFRWIINQIEQKLGKFARTVVWCVCMMDAKELVGYLYG